MITTIKCAVLEGKNMQDNKISEEKIRLMSKLCNITSCPLS